MDLAWADVWELFGYAILSAALAAVVCPLVGCFLLVRRTGFYGVALPQFAAAGVAFAWALPVWGTAFGLAHVDLEQAVVTSPHAVKNYLLASAALFTFGGLFVLLALSGRKETDTGRVAAAFAVANAATILLATVTPHGAEVVQQLLRGEILTVDLHEFETIGAAYGLVLLLLGLFHRDLLLVSFDPDMARILGKPVRCFEGVLLAVSGVTVSVGALIVGPVVLFGLLVIPPLAARGLAGSMRGFYVLASALGVLATGGGVVASFLFDWPMGPAVVAVAAVELPLASLAARLLRRG